MIDKFVTKIRDLLSNQNHLVSLSRSVLLTSLIVSGVVIGTRQMGLWEGLELEAYDQLLRSRPDEGMDDRLLVVAITETDIQTRKEYPLEDGTLADLLTKLEEYEPRAIGIDIIRDVPQGEAQGRIALEQVLQQNENIIAVCKLSSATEPGIAAAPGVPEERVGFADLPLDPGGKLRRALLLSTPIPPETPPPDEHLCNYPDPENQLLSLSFQLALLYLEPEGIFPELTEDGELKIASTTFKRLDNRAGAYQQADAGNYQLMLNYRSAYDSVRQVSLTEVLEEKIDPNWVRDQIVLIGYTAPIVKDDFFTPYSAGRRDDQTMPGVVIHAQNTSQILSTVLNNRPLIWYWSEGNEILWIIGWSLVGGILAWRIRRLWLFAIATGVGIIILYGSCYLLFVNGGWIPLVTPAIAFLGTAVGTTLVSRGYAKALYQGVKKFVFKVEIDEEKKQQQVAEITESETFAHLQSKAAQLRERKREKRPDSPVESSFEETESSVTAPTAETTEEDDYLATLQKKGKALRPTKAEVNSSSDSLEVSEETDGNLPTSEVPQTTEEDDYFQQLQKRGRNLKKDKDSSNL